MAIKAARSFGKALCEHFNLPADQVFAGVVVNTAENDVFSVTLTIALTADDLAGIAKRMAEQSKRP